MSATIDQRVVEMRFDNKQFESNVSTSMSTIEKLKQKLNLPGAAKGLENVSAAAKNVNMSALGNAVQAVQAKFSALQVIGTTALANITNSAVNAGKRIISALTIDPIKTGFSEYETQINAVQTILANTQSKGTTLTDVNKALDELNTYADKTIYNFTEMTRNIGTFTAAGVDLDTSVSSIKGIANLAAVSGSTSQQASTAMYQLSQALAAGKVQLMDWNSVVNAGMGGQVFQDALKRTAKNMGKDVDSMIEKYGSFRESLTQGEWLTADVLTETLTQLSGAYTEADLIAKGYTESQVKEIMDLADTAVNAATKVKTFTQLWDTLKEAAQSGWTQSWEIIVGDFEEAKEMLTKVSDTIGEMINASSESRNNLLQGWKDAGGRDSLIEGIKNVFNGLINIAKPVKEAFRDIFPPMTSENLLRFTENFKNLTAKFKEFGTKYSDQIKSTFKGLFSILDIGKKIFTALGNSISELLGSSGVASVGDFIMNSLASVGDFFTSLNENFDVNGITDIFSSLASGISNALGIATDTLSDFGGIFSTIGGVVRKAASSLWDGLKTVFSWISENFSVGDIFAGLAGGGIFVLAKKLMNFVQQLSELFDGGILGALFGGKGGEDGDSIKDKISDIFDGVGEALQGFTASVKVGSFVAIAGAMMILSAAFKNIAQLDAAGISKSLVTMGVSLGIMMKALNGMPTNTKFSNGLTKFTETTNLIKSGIALMFMAKAIDILSDAMLKLSDLSWEEIGKGLVGVGGGIAALCGGLKLINGSKVSIGTSIAMLALAKACEILGDAMQKFVGFSWDEIARGLAGMGGALAELVAALSVLSKVGGWGALLGSGGIFIAVQSLGELAESLKSFSGMQWDEIGRGLAGMGGALGELAIALGILSKIGGFGAILGGTGILITVQSLSKMAESLKSFSTMAWDEIGRGLSAMGGALAEVAGSAGVLGKLAGFSGIFGAGAIWITVQGLSDLAEALKEFASMSWSDIGRGLVAMGGALAEVGTITGALGLFAGFSGILGGTAIWTTVQSLSDLATAFEQFAAMSWGEIGRGLAAMGGALLEVGAISGALGMLTGFAGILGGAAIWTAVQGLGDLADAFKKFGEMSWGEIGRGLVAMGTALSDVAIGGLLNTLSGFGAKAIAEVAAPLGDLADSVKKWSGVAVPVGLGLQLSSLASGLFSFTLSGGGASAISKVAAPLGVMADSVKKWTDVTVPENLGTNLSSLATGVKAFTLGGNGAGNLAEAAPGIGAMADSVSKWIGLVVPEDLGTNLDSLGLAVKAFTFGGNGAGNLAEAAPGVAAMADAVSKWTGVIVPEELTTNLSSLATGVKAFTFGGSGAGSLSEAAPAIGTLADSITKWTGVVIPENLSTNLSNLATGVKAFTFGGSGASSLVEAAPALGILADSVKKWTGVTVPENLGTNLSSLASSIKAFTWGGNAAEALSVAAPSIGVLADSVKKWTSITVPEELCTNLSSLATSVKDFTDGGTGAETLSTAATGLGAMADSIAKWSGVIIPEGLSTNLSNLATSLKGYIGLEGLTTVTTSIDSLADATGKLASINFSGVAEGLASLHTSMTGFSGIKESISGLGSSIVNELVTPLTSAADIMQSAGSKLIDKLTSGIKKGQESLGSTGKTIADTLKKAVEGKSSTLKTAGETLASKAVSGIRSKYNNFKSVGGYLGDGLVAGLNAKQTAAYSAGYALGKMAAAGVKAGAKVNSPSKLTIETGKGLGEGLVVGMSRMSSAVRASGVSMGELAAESVSTSISRISDIISSDIDTQPTIRPVLDLSNVRTGADAISGMFGTSVGVSSNIGAISTMMNRRGQNGVNDDVVSAINKLQDRLNNIGNTTYQINGITYDDGSNVSNAIQTLVRAVKIGGRV